MFVEIDFYEGRETAEGLESPIIGATCLNLDAVRRIIYHDDKWVNLGGEGDEPNKQPLAEVHLSLGYKPTLWITQATAKAMMLAAQCVPIPSDN